MTTFRLVCAHCGTAAEIKREWIGRKGRCNGCKQVMELVEPPIIDLPYAPVETIAKSTKKKSGGPVASIFIVIGVLLLIGGVLGFTAGNMNSASERSYGMLWIIGGILAIGIGEFMHIAAKRG